MKEKMRVMKRMTKDQKSKMSSKAFLVSFEPEEEAAGEEEAEVEVRVEGFLGMLEKKSSSPSSSNMLLNVDAFLAAVEAAEGEAEEEGEGVEMSPNTLEAVSFFVTKPRGSSSTPPDNGSSLFVTAGEATEGVGVGAGVELKRSREALEEEEEEEPFDPNISSKSSSPLERIEDAAEGVDDVLGSEKGKEFALG